MTSTLTRTAAALAVAALPLIAGATTAQAGDRPSDGRQNYCKDKKKDGHDTSRSISYRDQCDPRDPRPPYKPPTKDPGDHHGDHHDRYDRTKHDDRKHDPRNDHKRHDNRKHDPRDHHKKRDHRVKVDPYNEVRTATATYFSVGAAELAGYKRPSTGVLRGCITQTPGKDSPAMGFHWINTALEDATVELTKPEALVYEPTKDGKLDLVAVEYIVPKDAWDKAGNLRPPKLFGHEYGLVSTIPGVKPFYALHAWVWKFNPDGIHADFNPLASCRYAGLIK